MRTIRAALLAITVLALAAPPFLVGTSGPASVSSAVYAAALASAPTGLVVHQSNSPNACDAPNDPTTDRCGFQPQEGTPYVHVNDNGDWTQVSAEENNGPIDDNDNDDNDNDDNDNDDNDNDD
jgi:hypothetical protein